MASSSMSLRFSARRISCRAVFRSQSARLESTTSVPQDTPTTNTSSVKSAQARLTGGQMARLYELEAKAQSDPDWRTRAQISPLAEAGLPIPTLPGFKKVKPSELYLKREQLREQRSKQELEQLKASGKYRDVKDLSREELAQFRREHRFPDYTEIIRNRPVVKPGFMNMGAPRGSEDTYMEDDEFEGNEITSMAHGQLDQHREFRHYARIAAWEMPLLTQLAKDFEPPSRGQYLRFRYTHYMGEQHPAEKKVVVEFSPADVPNLTQIQNLKLKKLVGARYNPQSDIIKIGCEMFETPAQNKRYICETIEKLLKEARDPKDDFADVPLDVRHHKFKHTLRFPETWKLTPERRAELASYREQISRIEEEKQVKGLLVDGEREISRAFARAAVPELAPVGDMAMAGRAKAKGAKRVPLRR